MGGYSLVKMEELKEWRMGTRGGGGGGGERERERERKRGEQRL